MALGHIKLSCLGNCSERLRKKEKSLKIFETPWWPLCIFTIANVQFSFHFRQCPLTVSGLFIQNIKITTKLNNRKKKEECWMIELTCEEGWICGRDIAGLSGVSGREKNPRKDSILDSTQHPLQKTLTPSHKGVYSIFQ